MTIDISEGRNGSNVKDHLFRRIRPFLAHYKISREKLEASIEEAFYDAGEPSVFMEILPLIFWRIFGCENILWINPTTPAGNIASLDVLVTAYAMWDDAQRIALKRGLDSADAAEALTNVVYQLTDRIAYGAAPKIDNIRKYLFVGCIRTLSRIAENAGTRCLSGKRKMKNPSDDGAFINGIENAILCHDLLRTMPLKVRKAVVLRYMEGFSCRETAATVGMSNNAARKAIHASLKKAYETCMRELESMGVTKKSEPSQKAANNDR